MKKLYFLPFLFLAITTYAQKQIVVQNGTAQTFSDLNAAIAAATAGDTLYIPGGGFTVSAPVDKTLHWRGVGHYPDSTAATGHTQITNPVTFSGNCGNSTFEGIYFKSSINFGSADNEATGIKIKRCRIDGTLSLRSTADISSGNPDLDCQVSESVLLGPINANYGMNCRFEQNLIFGTIYNFYRCYFSHNSINTYVSYNRLIANCQYCQFANNVFAQSYGFYGDTYNCNFKNNLFANNLIYDPATSTFTGSGNITNVGADNIYTSIELGIRYFDYKNDYHLNPAATGTDEGGNTGVSIIGKAMDGTDMGIYGSSLPYKEGAVPYAPHIRSAEIDNEATNGELGVKITVAAQKR